MENKKPTQEKHFWEEGGPGWQMIQDNNKNLKKPQKIKYNKNLSTAIGLFSMMVFLHWLYFFGSPYSISVLPTWYWALIVLFSIFPLIMAEEK